MVHGTSIEESETLTECPDCGTPVSEMEWREKVVPSGVRLQHLSCPNCGGVYMSNGESERKGLYEKYEVRKDGELQTGCFVLKPATDPAAREALKTYVRETDNEELADDIDELVSRLDAMDEMKQRMDNLENMTDSQNE